MLKFGTLLALTLALAGYGAWRVLRARQMPVGNYIGVIALALWLTGVAIVWVARSSDLPLNEQPMQSFRALAWPATTGQDASREPVATSAAGIQVAPIESLVAGLEARLGAQPNDAQGWTLLAQSYAYTANEEGAERAIRRAVELGVEEAALRDRVARAKRSAHSVDLVGEALKTGVYR